jgi:hypothetical protein
MDLHAMSVGQPLTAKIDIMDASLDRHVIH